MHRGRSALPGAPGCPPSRIPVLDLFNAGSRAIFPQM
jgi:hypothetical protein